MRKPRTAPNGVLSRVMALTMALILIVILSSCVNNEYDLPSANEEPSPAPTQKDDHARSLMYPEKPAEELRATLESAIAERKLPIKVGGVERVSFEGKERAEITLSFTGGSDNMCVIFFDLKYLNSDFDCSLDGHDNPSFTMAFRDPDDSQSMVTVLALVFQYISPDVSDGEARQLAEKQDTTISIDGFSQPLDIGGYQVQARYTNPHVFARTQEFDAKLGVKVTAIKQIWGDVDTSKFKELKSRQDYFIITAGYSPPEDDYQTKAVYADFIVKNVWYYEEWVHGDYWVEVDVESMDGYQYTLRVETMRMLMNYEFGTGQRYTLYIGTGSYYGDGIVYAIQRTSSSKPNSRGVPHEMDYPNTDWEDPRVRIEPDGEGNAYDVCFYLVSQGIGDIYAALEGHGVGAKQWPRDPSRDGYQFLGWYDNEERTGSPYNMDTPIYRDTDLYVKWKYVGEGGVWPRAHRGEIEGVNERGSYSVGQTLSITADGYNMHLSKPKDQRFRWTPVTWRLSDETSGNFSGEPSFTADLTLSSAGEKTLYVTYLEEIFDGVGWQQTGHLREVEEVTFAVK